jgi:hypothetical protein
MSTCGSANEDFAQENTYHAVGKRSFFSMLKTANRLKFLTESLSYALSLMLEILIEVEIA